MRNSILVFLFSGLFLFSAKGWAQQGKDGAFTTATTTVVNVYTTLTSNALAGSTNLNVTSAAGIGVGDLLLLVQMQGVSVNAYHDSIRPWPALDSTNSYVINSSYPYGKVLNISSCGNNEFVEVNAVSGTSITLDCGLKNEYDVIGHVQVIRVPRYTTLTLNSGANITCPQWNGSTGGVVAVEVQGNTTINTGGKIDASALGFRGAAIHNHVYSGNSPTNDGTMHPEFGAWKGEGVYGDTAFYRSKLSADFACGALANAGGGGNDDNAGGGGGGNAGDFTTYPWTGKGVPDVSVAGYVTAWNKESANFATSHSSGGGRGGYTFSSSNQNPQTLAPGNSTWSGDSRRVYGGMGGEPLDYSTGKVFMGGGGGAGDENDGYAGAGGNGGGIVFLLSYGTISGGGQILANGANGSDVSAPAASFNNCTGRDGAGGAGGGGAVLIRSTGTITLTNATPISATGGKGGNVTVKCNASINHDGYGPGGGGGGGYIGTSSAVSNITVAGGVNGTLSGSGASYSSNIATSFPPNGATKGDVGLTATLTTFYITANSPTVCAGTSASLSVTANGTGIPNPISYNWYNNQTGGTPVFTGNPYNTGALSVGTYTYYAGTCPGTYRIPVVVTVLTAPTVSVVATPTAVCAGQTATLTASGASSYTWSANAGGVLTATATATPTVNTTYTVTGANGTCTNTQTVAVAITSAPTLTVTATPTAVCAGQTATLTASGASSYTWSANAGGVFTATATATPTVNTTYTVTGANGSCTSTQTVAVAITSAPTLTVIATPTAVCAGQTATLTASGASSYTWSANAGGVFTATATATPTVNTTYTVTGANGSCTSTQTVAVAITTAPTLTITATPTAVCAGQTATLTASGATSYTWSANAGGVFTATATATPTVNTTYTVTGANGSCTSTQTVAVAITTAPTLTITATPTAVCAGQTATLTASGASSYTWSANAGGVQTPTAVVTPTINTTYVVTGDNGGCTSTQSVTINMNAAPTLSITATPTTVCSGSSSTLTASGASSYTWSANAGGVLTSTAVVTPTVSTTYTVSGDNGGCISTQTVTVVMANPPTLTITATPAAICNGASSLLTGSGAQSYTWSGNAGGVNTSTVSVTPTVTTTYTLTGDSGGCVATQMIAVMVNNGPTAADSSSVSAACGQANGSYSLNSVTGGTAGYQINFNGGGLTPISSFPYTVSSLTAGIYPVLIQDNNGCTYTTSITINNTGGITKVDSTIGDAVCNPANSGYIVLTSVTGGTGPYQVDINGGGFTAIASFPDTVKNLSSGSYTVTVKDNSGCLHTSVINVGSIGGITQVNTSTQNAVCNPAASGAIVISSVNGGTSPFQYSLNGGSLTNIPSFPDSIKTLTAGTYTLLIQDAAGCSSTSTVSITSPNGPTAASSTTVNDTCLHSVGILTVGSVTGGTAAYQYSINGGSYQSSTSFTGLAAGIYTVSVKDNNGCTFSFQDTVNLTTIPSPTVTPASASFCQGGSTTLTSSSTTGNTWNTSATTQTISVNTADSFWVSITQNGCTVTSNTVVVTVNPNPTITVNSDSICLGTSTTLFATVVPVGGTINYTWSPSTGLSSTTGASVIANPGATTVYTITSQDANSCIGVTTTTVVVSPVPAALPADTVFHCLYQNVGPLSVTPAAGDSVHWYTSNLTPLASAPTPATNILSPPSTVYYVSQSQGNCEGPKSPITVMILAPPSADFVTNPASGGVFTAQTVTFTPTQISPYFNYFWNFNEPASGSNNTSTQANPTHAYSSEGLYCPHLLVISLQTGCADSNTVCVDVFNGISVVIPNIFTPNQDNINDVFTIKTDGINELICEIYDRWGLKMYSWNSPTGFWDGTSNGKACSDGTYFYVVSTKDVKGVSKTYKGYVQLIK